MRRGWDTQTVHAVEIRSETWCASCANDRGGNKGEERGGPLDMGSVWVAESPKEERNEREGGYGMRDEV